MRLPEFEQFCGVDFSGAKQAGRAMWVARLVPGGRRSGPPFTLVALDRLDALCGTAERSAVHAHLVQLVVESSATLWGFDFPFGLPVELFPESATWDDQFAFLGEWGERAYACGLECVARARQLAVAHHRTALHCRRLTDVVAKAPFDTFHYRMVYRAEIAAAF
jgi:hypothetical protein